MRSVLLFCLLADQSAQSSALHLRSGRHDQIVSLPLSTGAACLDGSPYMFMVRPGDRSHWTLRTQGGEFCFDEKTCESAAFSSTRYSSKEFASSDHACGCENLNAYGKLQSCTCVYLPACDAGYFTGQREDALVTSSGAKLMFRGRRNYEGALKALLRDHGLGNATEVVFQGASSGATATVLYLDEAAKILPSSVRLHGLSVGGFTLDHKDVSGEHAFVDTMKNLYNIHNSHASLSSTCLDAFKDQPWHCLVGSNFFPFVDTPFFMQNSIYDSWQMRNVLGIDYNYSGSQMERLDDPFHKNYRDVQQFGKDFVELVKHVTETQAHVAVYLTPCVCHTNSCNFQTRKVHGQYLAVEMGKFFNLGHNPRVLEDIRDPTYECCDPRPEEGDFSCSEVQWL